MTIKKIISLLLITVLIVGLFPGNILANKREPELVLSGKQFVSTIDSGVYTLTLSLKNNPGIVSLRCNLMWDTNVFDLIKIEKGSLLDEMDCIGPESWNMNTGEIAHNKKIANPATFYFRDYTCEENYEGDGDILVCTFKLKEGVQEGYSIDFGVKLTVEGSSLNVNLEKIYWLEGSLNISAIECTHEWGEASCANPETCILCGETRGNVLNHIWVAGAVMSPTCTEEGYTDYSCSRCSETKKDNIILANGHGERVYTYYTESTCTVGGGYKTVCSICNGYPVIVEFEPIGHSWSNGMVTKAPTCTENGILSFTCANGCGEVKEQTILKIEHNYVQTTIAPTCVEQGYTILKCTICGDEQGEKINIIPPSGQHDWVAGEVVAPTCTAGGYTPNTCSICGETTNTDETDALGHTWGEGVVTAPTCIAGGYTTKTCSVCDATEQYDETEIDPDAHNWELGVCTLCGAINYGDVNGDGVIDDVDDMLLTRYLAQWPDIDIIEATADVNGDGEIDEVDNATLARYLAQWPDIVLGPVEG